MEPELSTSVTSLWIKIAETAETKTGLWIASLTRPVEQVNLADLDTLRRQGWQQVRGDQQEALLTLLYSQCCPVRMLRLEGEAHELVETWAQTVAIERVLSTPVVLAFTLDEWGQQEHETGGEQKEIPIAQPVSPPWTGKVGLIMSKDSTSVGESIYMDLAEIGAGGLAAQQRLSAVIAKVACGSGWEPSTPQLQAILEVQEHELQGLLSKLTETAESETVRTWLRSQIGQNTKDLMDTLWPQAATLRQAVARRQNDPAGYAALHREIQEAAFALASLYWQQYKTAPTSRPVGRADLLRREPQKKPRKIPQIARLFRSDAPDGSDSQAEIPSALPVQAVCLAYSNAQSGAVGWKGKLPTFIYEKEAGKTIVQVRPADINAVIDESNAQLLWQQVKQFTDLDGDVFLAMLAQAITEKDEEGYTWITAAHILDYRGIEPIKKTERGRERRAGHRREDIAVISGCVARQQNTWITVDQRIFEEVNEKGRRTKTQFTHTSRLMSIDEEISQQKLDFTDKPTAPSIPIAWRYKPGTWLKPFLVHPNRQTAVLLQQALRYDPYREQWEKRLARYFIFHLRINASHGGTTLTRNTGRLLDELKLPINERDPERTRKRFEQAMNRLVADRLIDFWKYQHDIPELPARLWLKIWLNWTVEVSAAPQTQLRYESIAEHAQREKERDQGRRDGAQRTRERRRADPLA